MVARSSRGGGQTNSPGHNADEELVVTHSPVPVLAAGAHGSNGAGIGREGDPMFTLDTCGAAAVLQPLAFDTTQITSKANVSNPKPGDPCHPLAAGAHAPAIAFDCKASGQNGFGVGEIASTQRAMGHAGSHTNGGGHQAVMQGMQVRRLTPLECERLQGFPDGYTAIPSSKRNPALESREMRLYFIRTHQLDADDPTWPEQWKRMAADGPRYKALGNSWAVPCARWIGQRIQLVVESA